MHMFLFFKAVYHHPSLGRRVDITIVRFEIQAERKFKDHDGEREGLLKEFCKYQQKFFVKDDDNIKHFDMSVLFSSLDMYGVSRKTKKKSYATMGLSTVTGVCTEKYSCVIGRLNVHIKDQQLVTRYEYVCAIEIEKERMELPKLTREIVYEKKAAKYEGVSRFVHKLRQF